MQPYDIAGKTALVTGANRGIGKAITESLLEHGIGKVYAAVRDPASAKELKADHGDRIVPLELDLRDAKLIESAAAEAGDTHIVINNAGVLRAATVFSDDVFDAFEFEMDVNVKGLLRMIRAFAPILARNGGGAFVQLNSVASMKCFPDFATYCASKAAAYSVTQALRTQLADQGTAVFSVHPGPIDTEMGDAAGLGDVAESPSLVGEALVEAFKTGTFHVFPDSMARQVGEAYQSFAEAVVEAEMSETS